MSISTFVAAVLLLGGQSQATPPSPTAALGAAACRLIDILPERAPAGGAGVLAVACGGHFVAIGRVEQFTQASGLSGEIVVVARQAGATRVWFASPAENNKVFLLQDVTRDLTKALGRAGDIGLGNASIDLSTFAPSGSIGISDDKSIKKIVLITLLHNT